MSPVIESSEGIPAACEKSYRASGGASGLDLCGTCPGPCYLDARTVEQEVAIVIRARQLEDASRRDLGCFAFLLGGE